MPKVSIVVLNFNGRKFLNNCLRSVFGSSHKDFEVILVDNNSNDGSADIAYAEFSRNLNFKLIRNCRNYGYAEGNNIGVSFSSHDAKYIVLLNPDTVVDPFWLDPMVSCMQDEKVAVIQPKILMMNKNKKIDSVGHFVDMLTFTVQVGYNESDTGQYDQVRKIFGANGSAIMIKKDVFLKLKGFDTDFFMYFEESDFCWRVWLLGYQILCVPKAVVYHYSGGLTEGTTVMEKRLYFTFRNKYYSMIKNLELYRLIFWFPISLILRFGLFFFTRSKREYLISYIKAVLSVLTHMSLPIRKRSELIRAINNTELLNQGVIKPFNIYYLLNKTCMDA